LPFKALGVFYDAKVLIYLIILIGLMKTPKPLRK